MTNDDIASLIGRVSLRDRNAFFALYTNTSAKLYGICVRILKDRGEAEEALQEVYIKVWRRAERYVEGQTSAMAWLAAIARNHAIDVIRARKPASSDIDAAFDIADPAPGPERSALMQGEGRRIDACMEQLEAERASAVRKAYVDGESYQDLAELYGVPLNTMRTWLRRSLLKLRECMDNDDSE